MTIPAAFADAFASYRRMLAGSLDDAVRVKILEDCAYQSAKSWIDHGLARPDAVDEIHDMAVCVGLGDSLGNDRLAVLIGEALQRGELEREVVPPLDGSGEQYTNGHDKTLSVPITFPFPIDAESIPRRQWIVPGLLLRRNVSVLVAPPGSGKSLLTLQLALICATGTAWGGWKPRGEVKTLVINAEDDSDEMRRRLYAASTLMACDVEKLRPHVAFAETPSDIVIAKADSRTKTVVRTPMVEAIVATILDNGFDVVIIDPFAETFEGDENSNSELKWAAVLWREIARRTNAAVLLVHHTKKYGAEAGSIDAARGASALVGVARIVSTLFTMTEQEATTFNVDSERRHEYLRFDDAKANLSLVTFNAKWFFKRSYVMPNGHDSEPPDEVGVLEPWRPISPFDALDNATGNSVLMAIDAGITDDAGNPTGDRFTATKRGRSSKRWAGQLVQDQIGCTDKDAQKVINQWVKNGVLVEVVAPTTTSKGQGRKGLRVDMTKLPGTTTESKML